MQLKAHVSGTPKIIGQLHGGRENGSCVARRQHEIRALMHMSRDPAMAAHLRSKPTPTAADLASGDIIDRAPLKNDKLGKGGSGHLGPDMHTCRTEIDHKHHQQGNGARWEDSGVAALSAPNLPVSKTTTNAATACASDMLMVATLLPSDPLRRQIV